MEFAVFNKLSRSSYVPFLCTKEECRERSVRQEAEALPIHGFWAAKNPSEEVLFAFYELGPVQIGIAMSHHFLEQVKEGGVYQGALNFRGPFAVPLLKHALVLKGEGYCSKHKQFYWRAKNSHGKGAGDQGFVNIIRDTSLPDDCKRQTILRACIPVFNLPEEAVSLNKIALLADGNNVRYFSRSDLEDKTFF